MKKCKLLICDTMLSEGSPDCCPVHNYFNPSFLKAEISEKIKKQMLAIGINKKEVASLCGVYPSVVTKWLSGKHNFTIDTLTLIGCKLAIKLI